jgi:hypothetical protein
MVFFTTMFTTADVNIHALIAKYGINKNPCLLIFLNILNFVISGLTIWMSIPYLAIKAWVIKTCYNNGQKERLCLIIDKCRRQKLCKRAQKISAAAPLRLMASR